MWTTRIEFINMENFFHQNFHLSAITKLIAQEYFPLTRKEAKNQGYKWKEKEERNYAVDIKNEDIPDNIKDVNEEYYR